MNEIRIIGDKLVGFAFDKMASMLLNRPDMSSRVVVENVHRETGIRLDARTVAGARRRMQNRKAA